MNAIHEKLVDYLQDTHAMEQNVRAMLESMLRTTQDPEMIQLLQIHHQQTVAHEQRIADRLRALGRSPSVTAEMTARVGAWFKGLQDTMRNDKPAKNLRDGFITEHVEIAAYELLERLAHRDGDEETAALCWRNKEDEYEMARRLGAYWDRAIDQTLHNAGVDQDVNGANTGSYGTRAEAAERGSTWTGASADADMGLGLHGDTVPTDSPHDAFASKIPDTAALEEPRNPADAPEHNSSSDNPLRDRPAPAAPPAPGAYSQRDPAPPSP